MTIYPWSDGYFDFYIRERKDLIPELEELRSQLVINMMQIISKVEFFADDLEIMELY